MDLLLIDLSMAHGSKSTAYKLMKDIIWCASWHASHAHTCHMSCMPLAVYSYLLLSYSGYV